MKNQSGFPFQAGQLLKYTDAEPYVLYDAMQFITSDSVLLLLDYHLYSSRTFVVEILFHGQVCRVLGHISWWKHSWKIAS